jgi:hypothetical protein
MHSSATAIWRFAALNNAGQFSNNSKLVALRGVLFAKLERTEEAHAGRWKVQLKNFISRFVNDFATH